MESEALCCVGDVVVPESVPAVRIISGTVTVVGGVSAAPSAAARASSALARRTTMGGSGTCGTEAPTDSGDRRSSAPLLWPRTCGETLSGSGSVASM